MPIQSIEQRKRQKILLLVGLGIILVTALIVYFGFLAKKSTPPGDLVPGTASTAVPKSSGATEQKLKKINLDFEFLNEKIIPFLKIHGDIPVKVNQDKVGRNNPFIPY